MSVHRFLFVSVLLATFADNALGFQVGPGGAGGAGDPPTNVEKVTISDDQDPATMQSKITLSITGLAPVVSTSSANPHNEQLASNTYDVSAAGSTWKFLSNAGSSALTGCSTSSSFLINSFNLQTASATSERHLENSIKVHLNNRKVTLPPPGSPPGTPSKHDAYVVELLSDMALGSAPFEPFGAIACFSGGTTNADMPQLNGLHLHERDQNGNLVWSWIYRAFDEDNNTISVSYSSDQGGNPPVIPTGRWKVTFAECNVTPGLSDYSIIISKKAEIVTTKSTTNSVGTGFYTSTTVSSGTCIVNLKNVPIG